MHTFYPSGFQQGKGTDLFLPLVSQSMSPFTYLTPMHWITTKDCICQENVNTFSWLTLGRRGRHEVHGDPRLKMRPHHVELAHRYVPQPIPFSTFMAPMTTLFSGPRR